jgi:hypothetical protein
MTFLRFYVRITSAGKRIYLVVNYMALIFVNCQLNSTLFLKEAQFQLLLINNVRVIHAVDP